MTSLPLRRLMLRYIVLVVKKTPHLPPPLPHQRQNGNIRKQTIACNACLLNQEIMRWLENYDDIYVVAVCAVEGVIIAVFSLYWFYEQFASKSMSANECGSPPETGFVCWFLLYVQIFHSFVVPGVWFFFSLSISLPAPLLMLLEINCSMLWTIALNNSWQFRWLNACFQGKHFSHSALIYESIFRIGRNWLKYLLAPYKATSWAKFRQQKNIYGFGR